MKTPERAVASIAVTTLYPIIIASIFFIVTGCNKEVITTNVLEGTYTVSYKVHKQPDGTKKYYYPIGTDVTGLTVTGWMAETKLIFENNSLGISQLSNQGWNTGYVELERINGRPSRVGCHYVESVDESHISWYQDDVIIEWVLVNK